MKTCTRCGAVKPLEEFHRNKASKDGRNSACKICMLAAVKFYYEANPEPRRAYARKYQQEHRDARQVYRHQYRVDRPEKHRDLQLQRDYGITLEEHDRFLAVQGNACAICGEVFQKTPCVDHDHTTGQVRGLLCHTCNQALGYVKDNPAILREAAWYLEHPQTILQEAI